MSYSIHKNIERYNSRIPVDGEDGRANAFRDVQSQTASFIALLYPSGSMDQIPHEFTGRVLRMLEGKSLAADDDTASDVMVVKVDARSGGERCRMKVPISLIASIKSSISRGEITAYHVE